MLRILLQNILIALFSLGILGSVSSSAIAQTENSSAADIEQLDFANGLFQRGFYQMAIDEYIKLIDTYPKSTHLHEAFFGIAESLFFLKSYDQARDQYEDYIKLFGNNKKAAISDLRIGQLFFLNKEYDKALSRFDQIKSRDLDNSLLQLLYLHTARAYKAKDDKRAAFEYYKNAANILDNRIQSALAKLEIGDMFAEDGEYEMGIDYYAQAFTSTDSTKIRSLALYKKGQAQFSNHNYSSSAETFKALLRDYPDQEIADNALTSLLLSYQNRGKYETLIEEYLDNKKRDHDASKFFDMHYTAVESYIELGKYKKALSLLDKILSFKSLDSRKRHICFLKKAEVMLKARRFKQTIGFIEQELKSPQQDADQVLYIKAEARYGLEEFDKAYILYKKIVDQFPQSPFADDALYAMAYAENSLGNSKEAFKLFLKYFKTGKDEHRRQEALYKAILLEIRLGYTESATKHCELFLSTFKDGPLIENLLFRLGSLYSDLTRYDKAVDIFKKFTGDFPKSKRMQKAYFLLGYNLQLLNRYDEALTYYEKVLSGDPENALCSLALKNKASIYLTKGNDDAAAKSFNEIIKNFKDNDLDVEAYLWLARYFLATKKFDDLLSLLSEIETKKDSSEIVNEVIYLRAEAFKETDNFDEAIKSYNKILSSKADNIYKSPAHLGKGISLSRIKRYAAAKDEFEAAIEKSPDDNTITMHARFELAGIEELTGDPETASKLYMLVAVLYNDNYYCPEALFKAGKIFESMGNKQAAIKAYKEIVGSYRKSPMRIKAKDRIKYLNEE